MTHPVRLSRRLGLVVAAALTAAALAACGSGTSHSTAAAAASSSTPAAATGGARVALSTAHGAAGTYLVGASGRAVYMWAADHGDRSACSGACAQAWPPVLASGRPAASGAVTAARLGTVARTGGAEQVTYDGHPLYYFVEDPNRGTVNGQGSDGFGAKWWLVAPSGAPITHSGHASGASSSSSGSHYGY